MQVRYQAGRRRLVGAGGAARLSPTISGGFAPMASRRADTSSARSVGGVQSAELPGYARTYFPGTPNASEAQFVAVDLSQEVTGIDFSLAREKTAVVSGTLLDAAGVASTAGSVRLMTEPAIGIGDQRSRSARG